ncbi:hypothetical protein F4775DRAFT_321060 [Biscogniauxia sp. FL1348]|nr:hypothetical protein F4775DRAFT_321060 [Biscogniauxia sp. FL1348]
MLSCRLLVPNSKFAPGASSCWREYLDIVCSCHRNMVIRNQACFFVLQIGHSLPFTGPLIPAPTTYSSFVAHLAFSSSFLFYLFAFTHTLIFFLSSFFPLPVCFSSSLRLPDS